MSSHGFEPAPGKNLHSSLDSAVRIKESHAQESAFQQDGILDRLMVSFDSPVIVNFTLLGCGAVAGALEFVTHLAVSRLKAAPAFHAFIDASVISLMTIALVGVSIASARARRNVMLEQIRVASELNHHLRNSLQVIANSRYLPEEKQAQAVLQSVDRIDETIRRLTGANKTPGSSSTF